MAMVYAAWPAMRAGELRRLPWGMVALVSGLLLALAVVIGLVCWLLRTFVAPIMYVRGCNCDEGWREMWGLFRGHLWPVFLFLVMQVLLGAAAGTLMVLLTCMTCCMAGLPVVLQTVMQPYFLWLRAYGPYFLAQFGGVYGIGGGDGEESGGDGGAAAEAGGGAAEDEERVVVCPHCGAEQRVPEAAAGAYECSACGGGFVAR